MGTKLSEMTEIPTSLAGSEPIETVQSGASYYVKASNIGGGPCGVVTSAGALSAGRGVTSVVKNATGDYTITFTTTPEATSFLLLTSTTTGKTVSQDSAIGATVDVLGKDDAGVAADCGFTFLVVTI